MAKPPAATPAAPHQPTIPAELARKRMQKLLEQIPEVRSQGRKADAQSIWRRDVKVVLAEFYGEQSLVFQEFKQIRFSISPFSDPSESDLFRAFNSGLDQAAGFLTSRVNDLQERIQHDSSVPSLASPSLRSDSRKVFVVHGHDHGTKETVARFLGKLDLEPIILHEQADQGRTIFEKFEDHAEDVGCAVVILTADDFAASKAEPDKQEDRARQNVVFEFGYFAGKLGRNRTFALVEKGVALPSDIHGLVYIPLEDGTWHMRLVKELKAAGLDVDANKAF